MTYYNFVTISAGAVIAAYAANRNMLPVTVSDSLANVAAYLDALNAVARAGKVTSISLTDLQDLRITNAQMTSDSLVLGLLPVGYTLLVNGASVADAGALQANPDVAAIAVNDSPAAVAPALGVLNSDKGRLGHSVGLAPTSGIEEIANFQYGVDHLSIDLQGSAATWLVAFDINVEGQHAMALADCANLTHDIVLLGMGTNAVDLMAHHLTSASGSAMAG